MKVDLRLRKFHHSAVIAYIKHELHKEGVRHNDLISGIENRFKNDVKSTGCSDSHDDMVSGEGQPRIFSAELGYLLTHLVVASVRHVTVHARRVCANHAAQLLFQRLRRLGYRITEGKIEYIFYPMYFLQFLALLEHGPYP